MNIYWAVVAKKGKQTVVLSNFNTWEDATSYASKQLWTDAVEWEIVPQYDRYDRLKVEDAGWDGQ